MVKGEDHMYRGDRGGVWMHLRGVCVCVRARVCVWMDGWGKRGWRRHLVYLVL